MKKHLRIVLLAVVAAGVFARCADVTEVPPVPATTPQQLPMREVLPGGTMGSAVPDRIAGGTAPPLPAALRANGPAMRVFSRAPRSGFLQQHTRHVLLQNSTSGERAVWVVSGGSIVSAGSLGVVPLAWDIAGTGHFDSDSFEDIVWENTATGERALWFMNGNGGVLAAISLGIVPTNWRIGGAADYNNDGQDDLLWQRIGAGGDGARAVWIMSGSTVLQSIGFTTLSPDWRMVAGPDLTGDQRDDIVVENTATGDRGIWAMGGTVQIQFSVPLGNISTQWSLGGISDMDGDGDADLLWDNASTGVRALWLLNGNGGVTAAPALTVETLPWRIRAVSFPSVFGTATLGLQQVAQGLTRPVYLTAPTGDPRLFIVEQAGRIRIVKNGVLLTTPFLDMSSRVNFDGERGLLSVAFDPSYATNGRFYVYYTRGDGDIVVDRHTVSADPDVANTTFVEVIRIEHSAEGNHNGGLAMFGPDGMLYLATGDGGGGGDVPNNAQNINVLLGKMLRLNVTELPYTIPAGNPFVNQPGADEIWAYGLRNPWRYAFDGPPGSAQLYIADVGQETWEEINVVSATAAGINYGWRIMEGFACFNPASGCNTTGLTLPVHQYDHGQGCSVTGGFVYRGSAIPEAQGQYFYSDFCSGFLRSLQFAGSGAINHRTWTIPIVGNILSFGRDASGELYMLVNNGVVYRLVNQ